MLENIKLPAAVVPVIAARFNFLENLVKFLYVSTTLDFILSKPIF